MKLLKLSIRNIASIEKADIDFVNDLRDQQTGEPAGLFLITGETGTGKSALLDAIAMALYKTTPRLDGAAGQRGNKLIDAETGEEFNLTSLSQYTRAGITDKDESYSELQFEGNDGVVYVARLTLGMSKRAQKKADDENTEDDGQAPAKPTYYYSNPKLKWSCSEGEYAKDADIEPIRQKAVGMTFDQFCRMSMLAQGQFAEFLCGDRAKRETILEQLTNTEKFREYGEAIARIYKTCTEAKKQQETYIKGLSGGLLSEEEQQQLTERIRANGELESTELGPENQLAQRYKQSYEELSGALEQIGQTESRLPDLYDKWAHLQGELHQRKTLLQQREDECRAKGEQLKVSANAGLYEKAGEVLTHMGNLQSAAEKRAKAQQEKLLLQNQSSGLLKTQEQAHRAKEEARKTAEEQQKEADNIKEQRDALHPDEINTRVADIHKAKTEYTSLQTAYAAWNEAKAKHAKSEDMLKNKTRSLEMLQEELKPLETEKQQLANDYEQELQHYSALSQSVEDSFCKVRAQLTEKDDCPLCGQHIDMGLLKKNFTAWLNPMEQALQQKRTAKQEAEEAFNKKRGEWSTAKGELLTLEANVATAKKEADEAYRTLETTAKALKEVINEQLPQRIESTLQALADELNGLQQKQEQISNLQSKLDQAASKLNTLSEQLRRKETEEKKADSAVALNRQDIGHKDENIAQADRDLTTERAYLQPYLSAYAPDWEENTTLIQGRLTTDSQAYQELQDKQTQLTENAQAILRMEQVHEELAASQPDIPEPKESAFLPDPEGEWRTLTNQFSDVSGGLKMLYATREQKRRILQPYLREDDSINVDAIHERAQQAQERLQKLQAEMAADRQRLSDNTAALERVGNENTLLQELTRKENHWKILNNYFGGTRFRTLVQTYLLRPLLKKANVYMEKIYDRYELTCDEQNEQLSVLVYDNDYRKLRGPMVLSGGERFMISLALSLALSDLHKAGMNVDILFIDEGFGTLDKQSLNSVLCTLQTLQTIAGQQNRRVGLISHREELSSIPTQILVRKKGSGISEVVCPFEGEI